jgi:hypothetical protein
MAREIGWLFAQYGSRLPRHERGTAHQRQGIVVGDDPADRGENLLHRRLMRALL